MTAAVTIVAVTIVAATTVAATIVAATIVAATTTAVAVAIVMRTNEPPSRSRSPARLHEKSAQPMQDRRRCRWSCAAAV
jgi:hypothetical protein